MRDLEVVQFGETVEGNQTYFAKCGCKTFTFIEKESLITFLSDYIRDPQGYEERLYAKNGKGAVGAPPIVEEARTQVVGDGSLNQTLRR